MRVLPFLLAGILVAAAGCTTPSKDKDDDPLLGLCPQWTQGPGSLQEQLDLQAAGTVTRGLGTPNATHLARPLDLFRIQFGEIRVEGNLELRGLDAAGDRLTLRDYRGGELQMVPVVTVNPGLEDRVVDVFLSPVLEDGASAPQPAVLQWVLDGEQASVNYTVTYHYKVCGL